MAKRIIICTVIYYDGVEAYTTHRALYVNMIDKMQLTQASKLALKDDMNSAGVELLKVDFNGFEYDSAKELIDALNEMEDNSEAQYVLNKFLEYFVQG